MSDRQSYYLECYAHQNPVPVASRIGPHLSSGVITGRDPHSKEMPEGMAEQCANLFGHVRELMLLTGAHTDDIVNITFSLRHSARWALPESLPLGKRSVVCT